MGRETIPVKLIMQASSVELRSEANQTHLAVTARGLESKALGLIGRDYVMSLSML